jgi:hypothetical protein
MRWPDAMVRRAALPAARCAIATFMPRSGLPFGVRTPPRGPAMNLKVALAAAGLLVAGTALAVLCAPGCPAAPPVAAPLPAPAAVADEPPPPSRELQPVHSVAGAHVRDLDTTFDWGAIPAEATFKHVFVLHNEGDAALHIVRTRPS